MEAILFAVLAFLGPWIARVFSDDPEVIRFVSLYFKIVAVSYGFQGLLNVTVSIFNGLQMPGSSLRLMAIRTFLIVFPLVLIGSLLGPTWIFIGLAVGDVISAIYAAHFMRKSQRKWGRPIAQRSVAQNILADFKSMYLKK